MKTLNVNAAVPVVQHGPIAQQLAGLSGAKFPAGRRVYDTVTGQWVTVIGSTTAYLPAAAIEGVKSGE